MNKWMYVLGVVVIAGFAALGVMEMLRAQAPYVTTVRGVRAESGRPVQFQGKIVSDSASYDEKTDELTFKIADTKGEKMPVRYKGVKPGNFDSADHAVIRGTYGAGVFAADKILLKCPSKYQGK